MATKSRGFCDECRWWRSENGEYGTCHAGPPTAILTPRGVSSAFPRTNRSDSCGRWEEATDAD